MKTAIAKVIFVFISFLLCVGSEKAASLNGKAAHDLLLLLPGRRSAGVAAWTVIT
jgi:hypothetical protein